jgi:hypothetical protein
MGAKRRIDPGLDFNFAFGVLADLCSVAHLPFMPVVAECQNSI